MPSDLLYDKANNSEKHKDVIVIDIDSSQSQSSQSSAAASSASSICTPVASEQIGDCLKALHLSPINLKGIHKNQQKKYFKRKFDEISDKAESKFKKLRKCDDINFKESLIIGDCEKF